MYIFNDNSNGYNKIPSNGIQGNGMAPNPGATRKDIEGYATKWLSELPVKNRAGEYCIGDSYAPGNPIYNLGEVYDTLVKVATDEITTSDNDNKASGVAWVGGQQIHYSSREEGFQLFDAGLWVNFFNGVDYPAIPPPKVISDSLSQGSIITGIGVSNQA